MSINSKEKFSFLYQKNYFIGEIVDDEEEGNFDSWYGHSDEWTGLKNFVEESDFQKLIIQLVDIFRAGLPNDFRIAELFGQGYNYVQGRLIEAVNFSVSVREKFF